MSGLPLKKFGRSKNAAGTAYRTQAQIFRSLYPRWLRLVPTPQPFHRDNFIRAAIPTIMRRLRNYARLEPVFLAAVEHRRLLADAIKNVFVPEGKGSAPQIRSVAVRAERNQISGRALPALNALADERHGETRNERRQAALCPLKLLQAAPQHWTFADIAPLRRWTFSDLTAATLLAATRLAIKLIWTVQKTLCHER